MKWLQGRWLHGGQDGVAGAWAQQQEALGHRGEGVAREDVQAKSCELGPGRVKGKHGGTGVLADSVEPLKILSLGQGRGRLQGCGQLAAALAVNFLHLFCLLFGCDDHFFGLTAEMLVPENTMFFLFLLTALESGFD